MQQTIAIRQPPRAPRAQRTDALRRFVSGARAALAGTIAWIGRAIAAEFAASGAMRDLQSLSERDLRDIGLTPADVGRAAPDRVSAALYTMPWR